MPRGQIQLITHVHVLVKRSIADILPVRDNRKWKHNTLRVPKPKMNSVFECLACEHKRQKKEMQVEIPFS